LIELRDVLSASHLAAGFQYEGHSTDQSAVQYFQAEADGFPVVD
jgi:hypothetical protein